MKSENAQIVVLKRSRKKVERLEANLATAQHERNQSVLLLVSQGVPVADVASLAGITRDWVYKLINASVPEGKVY